MLTLSWRLSAAIHHCLRLHAPSNRLIAQIRTHRRRIVIVTASLAASTYLGLATLCAAATQDGGGAWLAGAVGLLIWDGFKLAWVALLPARTQWREEAPST